MDAEDSNKSLSFEFVHQLPKIDLHSHLSGSIGQEKLAELYKRRYEKSLDFLDCHQDFGTPEDANAWCFSYFSVVSKVVIDLVSLKECTKSVLESFANENCIYLELRTEPKAFEVGNSTADQYVDVIRECVSELNSPVHRMHVKLCLSIKRSYADASTTDMVISKIDKIIEISKRHRDLVVGIDICGNPEDDTVLSRLLPALLERSDCFKKLPITFHIGEVDADEEVDKIIDNIEALNIRRLGHVIHLKDRHIDRLNALAENGYRLGIEMCPTSNQVTSQLKHVKYHHFGRWWSKSAEKLLFSINTDDCGLFSCNLTGEVHKLANSFGLTMDELCTIQRQAVQSSFFPNKHELTEKTDQFSKNRCKN